ncbi:hypothetical protein [Anaerorhabdus furcosa]|uniref:Uncharacterized protein n=1 Tax=Anaerorhabdus furcosa TaxID=118967 RepID=A0A1T4M020_9FIRM|nr:hypothetical protein [Anaerorhabdus furcosa]SJZ60252.1 hypothetical protein SAMN02745191_1123 [Anaerorhabdus furcosa]
MPENNCEQCIKKVNEINSRVAKLMTTNKELEQRIALYKDLLKQKNKVIEEKTDLIARLMEV